MNSHLMRWIGESSFTVKYCKGEDNRAADIFSKYVIEVWEEIYNINDQKVQLLPIHFETNNWVNGISENLAEKQNRDMMLIELIKFNLKIMLTNECYFKWLHQLMRS